MDEIGFDRWNIANKLSEARSIPYIVVKIIVSDSSTYTSLTFSGVKVVIIDTKYPPDGR